MIAGFISGIIAALIQDLFMTVFKALGWTDRAYYDYAKVLIMFKTYPGLLSFIVGELAHLIFGGFLGFIFARLIKNTSSKYFYLKVIIWGPLLWFTTLGAGTIFRLPLFTDIPPLPAFMTLVGAIIYSFANGYALRFFDKKTHLL